MIESAWQYTLKPQLNAPWAHRILARLGFHEHLTNFRQHALRAPTSLTLLKRLQRRLHPLLPRRVYEDPRRDVQHQYEMLYRYRNLPSYQALRELRSAAFPVAQLYYLLRLTLFISEPFRAKACKLLQSAIRFPSHSLQGHATSSTCTRLEEGAWSLVLSVGSLSSGCVPTTPSTTRIIETRTTTLGDKVLTLATAMDSA